MSRHNPLSELIGIVQRALGNLPVGCLTQAATDAEGAHRLLCYSFDGTNNQAALQAIVSSKRSGQHLEAARIYLEMFRAELAAYLHDVAGSGRGAPVGGAERVPEPMPRWDDTSGDRQKTHGRWVDNKGRTHTLLSGERDEAFRDANERARQLGFIKGAGIRIFRAASHVELKFAVRMRKGQRATIVINNPRGPCHGDVGCRKQLPNFLPDDAELTVCWPGGRQTFQGRNSKP